MKASQIQIIVSSREGCSHHVSERIVQHQSSVGIHSQLPRIPSGATLASNALGNVTVDVIEPADKASLLLLAPESWVPGRSVADSAALAEPAAPLDAEST